MVVVMVMVMVMMMMMVVVMLSVNIHAHAHTHTHTPAVGSHCPWGDCSCGRPWGERRGGEKKREESGGGSTPADPAELVWCWYSVSMVSVWCQYGVGMVLVWCYCGVGMGREKGGLEERGERGGGRNRPADPAVLVWCWYGVGMVLQWCYNGVSVVSHGVSMMRRVREERGEGGRHPTRRPYCVSMVLVLC
jgi:hypothetical protein